MTKSQQQVAAFAFGIVFIITMLTLAVTVPDPTPFQYTVFRIVLALATAGIAAMIPGFLHVEIPGWLRAGGALAVFVIVYFYNPATLVHPGEPATNQLKPPATGTRTLPEGAADVRASVSGTNALPESSADSASVGSPHATTDAPVPSRDVTSSRESDSRSAHVKETRASQPRQAVVASTGEATSQVTRPPPPRVAHVTYDEFITSGGDNFVALQMFAPYAAPRVSTNKTSRFRGVFSADGIAPIRIDETAQLIRMGQHILCDVSLSLAPGMYRAKLSVVQDDVDVIASAADINVRGLKLGEAGVSRLILSNNVYPLPVAQAPTDPFSFGGLKVVPRGDKRFTTSEELWYFLELRRSVSGPTPAISVKIDVEGKTTEGTKVKMVAPWTTTNVVPIKGVPGHFGVGNAMPLNTFKPGTYRFTVKIRDVNTGEVTTREEEFIVESSDR